MDADQERRAGEPREADAFVGKALGRYRILRLLGQGGMGAVYEAEDPELGRRVALKVLPAVFADDPGRLERFKREARSLAALSHPNVVTLYSVEESGDAGPGSEVHFLTMELVEGEPLDRLIPERGLALGEILDRAVQLAEGLRAAHDRGIVHRDLKPANVIVDTEGRLRILDFGLAKARHVEPESSQAETAAALTAHGTVLGTAPYMSPEQVAGRPCDQRSDIFSFGSILYEMSTGRRPFSGESFGQVMSAVLQEEPPPISRVRPDLPEPLARIVERCLEKDPAKRFQTARALREALEELREGGGRASRPFAGAKWFGIAAAALVLAVAGVFLSRLARTGPPGPEPAPTASAETPVIRSIAVLPLDDYSSDPAQDFFAEGMTDELTTDLAMISDLKVISRGSVMQFRGAQRPPTPEIAKLLDVDAIVEGSVRRIGDRVRITAQLIDARADRHLWAGNFERESKDVLALQDELASAIAREIDVQLTPSERSRLSNAPIVDPEAYDAYLKGRYFFARPSDENLKKSIAYFEEATVLSPSFAPAFAGLSDAYLWAGYNGTFMTPTEAKPRARAAAEQAIRLGEDSVEAHTSMAVFELWFEHDWASSEREFRRALELNPNYAFARAELSVALGLQGRLDEAVAEGARAIELDPLAPQVLIDACVALTLRGDYEEVRTLARRAAELAPDYFFPYLIEGVVDLEAGKSEDAISRLEKANSLDAPSFARAFLGYAYGAAGDRTRAIAERERLANSSPRGEAQPFDLALVSVGLGEHERAIDLLEQAYAADSMSFMWLANGMFDPLRSDPRFQTLMRRWGFASG